MVYKEFISNNNRCFISKKDSDSFIFPKILVYNSDDVLLGYLMDYVKGHTFDKIDGNLDMKRLLYQVKLLEDEILNQSMHNVIITDLNFGNIIINSKGEIKIIDTDPYYYLKYESCSVIYERNLSSLSYAIIHGLLLDYSDEEVDKDLRLKNYFLNKEKNDCYFGVHRPSLFLENVLFEMAHRTRQNIRNVDDCRNNLKYILKRK